MRARVGGSCFVFFACACGACLLAKTHALLTTTTTPTTKKVCRGTAVTVVSPTAGSEEIANPFLQAADEAAADEAAAAT